MKKRIWIIVPMVCVFIAIVATILVSSKQKLKGGYGDELRSNQVVTRIVSTELFKEEDKVFIEINTSIWNVSNHAIHITNDQFLLNQGKPKDHIALVIQPFERVNIRQVYPYTGTVNQYGLYFGKDYFEFDFTLKNNQLVSENLKLKDFDTKNLKQSLTEKMEKNQESRLKLEEERRKKYQELLEIAEKQKQEHLEQQQQQDEMSALQGIYNSKMENDTSVIIFNEDASVKIIANCEDKTHELKITGLQKTKVVDKYTFTGEYESIDLGKGTIVFAHQNNTITILDAPNICLVGKTFEK